VVAHFVPQGQTADAALRRRLRQLGRNARNWTVVSSDQAVLASAREAQAKTLTAEAFAQALVTSAGQGGRSPAEDADPELSPAEVQDWLALFNQRGATPGKKP
jgi:hypothetical protein